MRLLRSLGNDNFTIESVSDQHPPSYAILSHTWGDEEAEVTFEDLVNGAGKEKFGYRKLKFCAQQARKDGLDHFWVDTCCINKNVTSELDRSIRSMFRWYRDAKKCYVLLSDVAAEQYDHNGDLIPWQVAFRAARWLRRGWTLQELLAPLKVEFFASNGEYLGDRTSLAQLLESTTLIASEALGSAAAEFRC